MKRGLVFCHTFKACVPLATGAAAAVAALHRQRLQCRSASEETGAVRIQGPPRGNVDVRIPCMSESKWMTKSAWGMCAIYLYGTATQNNGVVGYLESKLEL